MVLYMYVCARLFSGICVYAVDEAIQGTMCSHTSTDWVCSLASQSSHEYPHHTHMHHSSQMCTKCWWCFRMWVQLLSPSYPQNDRTALHLASHAGLTNVVNLMLNPSNNFHHTWRMCVKRVSRCGVLLYGWVRAVHHVLYTLNAYICVSMALNSDIYHSTNLLKNQDGILRM